MLNEAKYEMTQETKAMVLQGENKLFPVYRIPVEDLLYNRQNDRIATWISEYESEVGSLPDDSVEANAIIEEFIVNSNEEFFNRTKANIKKFGQTEAAIVLKNGIVVDGNRRFTALRQLSREEGTKFGYIKAVVLNQEAYRSKDIKALELNLQHAKEERVDYNPIDRLVGLYRDLISEKAEFTVSEYAAEIDEPEKKVKEELEVAELLIEYLDWIHQPLMFHIARNQNLNGPIREVRRMLKKVPAENKEKARDILFGNLLTLDGDVTRKIRDLKPIIQDNRVLSEVSEALGDSLDDLDDHLRSSEAKNEIKETHSVNVPKDISEELTSITNTFTESSKIKTAQKAPIAAVKKSLERLGDVEIIAAKRMKETDQEEFMRYLNDVIQKATALKDDFNA
ncbi:ParB/RepB/Spo0J family partition protein [Weissella confusa]|uniref:ParB/RepB/Spo0J family partition protein n=1 Tax=Weissella confusa TaxID=1583 RepID=UPI0005E02BC7|nr:ParB/RepB/Spo0J family partition protein [Weissella confusa]MBJ7673567.1 ParB/RepB/Spo0J family partition protein [Weissella confusa]COJ24435.1 ParB-like nuclease domain [Streptococcus pneumoniae]